MLSKCCTSVYFNAYTVPTRDITGFSKKTPVPQNIPDLLSDARKGKLREKIDFKYLAPFMGNPVSKRS